MALNTSSASQSFCIHTNELGWNPDYGCAVRVVAMNAAALTDVDSSAVLESSVTLSAFSAVAVDVVAVGAVALGDVAVVTFGVDDVARCDIAAGAVTINVVRGACCCFMLPLA